ncbi:ceramide glucosyltransferase-like [Pomacea canaliculata]|uniref:ceramide glucosyltransferase-like n=1 Tax=Pomacea canaliculata TaxID=400727 RepID=UPI000D730B8D|nr:ceramide glucosyltransferase-like [Pomacea canaliculata]
MSFVEIAATVLAVIIFCGSLFDWFIHALALSFGIRHLYKKIELSPDEELPGVSIIKPLTGVDPHLKSNLETFFKLNYPKYEILFSVQSEDDPAILVVKSLIESYPKVDAKLFIGIQIVGPNGKVNNMVKPYEAAKYDAILISDSGIKMGEGTLTEMVAELSPSTGMVLQMPFVCTRKGFASVYEQVYFGTMQARNCLSANAVGVNCSTGMSCLLRRDVLDKAGGLAEYGKYLAEDYFIADAIRKQGYKVGLCTTPAMQNCGQYSIGQFHDRLVRWAYLRMSMLPTLIILEPLSECMVMGIFASWAVQYLFDFSAMGYFLLHVLLWFLLDYILFRIVMGGPLPFSKFEFLVAWLLRETLSPYVLFNCHKNQTVTWRSKKYRLKWGGLVDEPQVQPQKTVSVV